MARFFTASSNYFFLIICLLFLLSASSDARKLLNTEKENKVKKTPASLADSLVLSALPKGTTPPSAPSRKGHAVVIDEKLFSMHLASIDRILRSVPSPGVGH